MMTSTELKIGLTNSARPSSRVLQPPGGAHSNIFAEPDVAVIAPRPKYNQQNSSNLNACMGSTDPSTNANQAVVKLRDEVMPAAKPEQSKIDAGSKPSPKESGGAGDTNGTGDSSVSSRGRVPPGGFSSGGFW